MEYSVIVPTYNRATLLKKCLEALVRQSIDKNEYEVIIINDGSKDNTDSEVKKFMADHLEMNIKYFCQKNAGPAKARNLGIKNATGKIVFFTDDDCVVPEKWVETLADGYRRHPEVAGVGGWYEYPEEIQCKSAFVKHYTYWIQKRYGKEMENSEIKTDDFLKNPAGNTSNMSYRKNILDAVGGFDEKMVYPAFDDLELKKRIMESERQLLYIPFFVLHLRPVDTEAIMKRFFDFGRGRYYFTKKYPQYFSFYYPSARKLKWKYQSAETYTAKCIALAEHFLGLIGWEYEQVRQKLFRYA